MSLRRRQTIWTQKERKKNSNLLIRGVEYLKNRPTLEVRVVQALYGVHGLVTVGHVNEGKVLDDRALLDRAVLFEQLTELIVEALLHVGDVELHGARVLPSAGLHVDGAAVQLVEMELADGLGGRLPVVHVDKSIVLKLGTLRHRAIRGEQSLHVFLPSVLGQVPNENLDHG